MLYNKNREIFKNLLTLIYFLQLNNNVILQCCFCKRGASPEQCKKFLGVIVLDKLKSLYQALNKPKLEEELLI
jgi:hypothetical protein